jgi:hypothetical protein
MNAIVHAIRRTLRCGRVASICLCLCLVHFSPQAARAANGLINPDFDNGVAGWTAIDGALAWNAALDVQACAGSGSATYSSPVLLAGNWTVTATSSGSCVPVTPGEIVAVRARLQYSTTVNATDIGLLGYTDANCSAGELALPIAGYGPLGPAIWFDFMLGLTVSEPTHSVRLLLRSRDPAISNYTFALDRTYVGPSEPIFLDGVDAASTCRWSQAVP